MKVLVCGSRDWADQDAIADVLADFTTEPDVEVMHGDAAGADRLAGEVASFYGFSVRKFPADWRAHGKAAGPIRNLRMLDEKPDCVLAFQRNGSRGTQHTIDEARKRGIPVEVHSS
jgi:hypothetical protein